MYKLVGSFLLIITLSGCAHQLFGDTTEPNDAPASISAESTQAPVEHKSTKPGVPQTPYKRTSKTSTSPDAYNE